MGTTTPMSTGSLDKHAKGPRQGPCSTWLPIDGSRPEWYHVFMEIASVVSLRATCQRAKNGVVVVSSDNQILSTGYNGAPRRLPHCTEVGCLIEGGHCVRAVHAEQNALIQAARSGAPLLGAELFSILRPCVRCANLIAQAGIQHVWFALDYDTDGLADIVFEIFQKSRVSVTRVDSTGPHVVV